MNLRFHAFFSSLLPGLLFFSLLLSFGCRGGGGGESNPVATTTGSSTSTSTSTGTSTTIATPKFTKESASLLESNVIFPGIVHDGTRLVISYGKGNQLYHSLIL